MPNRSEARVITPAVLRDWALPVPSGGKEARGTVLVVGGSRFTPGAVLLAGVAALRAGAGVLQLAAAESTATALSIQVPEALVVGLSETSDGAVSGRPGDQLGELVAEADVVAVGPGLKGIDETRDLLHLVLDAAGRNGAGARRVRPRRAQPRAGPADRVAGPWCSPEPDRGTAPVDRDLGDDPTRRRPSWPAGTTRWSRLRTSPLRRSGLAGGERRRGLGTSGGGDVRAVCSPACLPRRRAARPPAAAFAHAVNRLPRPRAAGRDPAHPRDRLTVFV
jgi:hypothetical protein